MSTGKPSNIGVIGLGIIGSRVVENLGKAGFHVYVWSRSPRAVPDFLASPRDVAQAATVIQLFVRDDAALIAAMEDMASALTPQHIVMNHATVSPAAVHKAAGIAAKAGTGFLDAPFTGSKNAAAAGKLVYYIGGETSLLEQVRAVLEASSSKIMHLGKIGDAMVLKIATNMISAVTVKGIAEALAVVRSQKVEPQKLLEALEANANYSALVGMKLPAMLNEDFEAHFSLRNMLKDADFGRALAKDGKLTLTAIDATADAMRQGVNAGKGDLDFSVIGAPQ
ncbi:MAG: 6-phosphogluconate dehydrogenase NAD-binding [Verrucomicrobiaceae bacterium]|nr:6-phosphogluconate dehydrogenase NAD-binding [Verrucomicrobiaceae bacterium]